MNKYFVSQSPLTSIKVDHKHRQNVAKSYKFVTEFFNIWHDFGY